MLDKIKLGVIADDFTGATDIAGFLVAGGWRTVQLNGVPTADAPPDIDAVVISLKSRSCPVDEAVQSSQDALTWLQAQGCEQVFFKYCSTFDSTEKGNIGAVTDALLAQLDDDFTVVCPALPVNGRTVFKGHLFVGDDLLSDSGMRHHPITPMTDANLLRLMDKQSQGRSGLVQWSVIEKGADAVQARFAELKADGCRYAVTDALTAEHLQTLGEAVKDMPLVTGGSGLGAGIAYAHNGEQVDKNKARQKGLPFRGAKSVVFSGSCSQMTNRQVAAYQQQAATCVVDIAEIMQQPQNYLTTVSDWLSEQLQAEKSLAPLVSATVSPSQLADIQRQYGSAEASKAVEDFFSHLSQKAVASGVKNFIVAGGETSGIVTQSLSIGGFHIGPQIAPGVPWVRSISGDFALALKSGNFGNEDFFITAQQWINGER